MIVTSNPLLAEKSRKFSGLGYSHLTSKAGKANLSEEVYQNPNYDRFSEIGFNYRMAPINAAIGLGQLKRAKRIRQRRMYCGQKYSEIINKANKEWIIPQKTFENRFFMFFCVFCTYRKILKKYSGGPRTILRVFMEFLRPPPLGSLFGVKNTIKIF